MPVYEYKCRDCATPIEHVQSMFDALPLEISCTTEGCGGKAGRVFSAPAAHFKGKGFYTTDYRGASGPTIPKNDSSGTPQETKAAADKAVDKKKES